MISKITSYSYLRAEGISCCFSITLPTNWFAITQYQLTKARIKLLNYMVTLSKSNEAPWVINSLIKSTCPLCAALKSGVPPSWKRRGTCSGQLHLHNGCWIIKEKYRNNILHEHSFKGNLRSKTHHCFYGIILLIWWKKIFFVQSFVGLWSVLTKLWSYKALNLEWVTSHPQIYKTFHSWCSLHVFIDFMEKEPLTQFYGCLDHFKWTCEVSKVWMIKLCFEVSDVTHVMNMHNMLTVACT